MIQTAEPGDPSPLYLGINQLIAEQDVLSRVPTCEAHHATVTRLAKSLIYWESVRPDLNGAEGIADLILDKVHCTDPNAPFCPNY